MAKNDYKYFYSSAMLEQMKNQISILDLAEQFYTLTAGKGRAVSSISNITRFSTVEHDSLWFFRDTNTFMRYSDGSNGDIFDFWLKLPEPSRHLFEEEKINEIENIDYDKWFNAMLYQKPKGISYKEWEKRAKESGDEYLVDIIGLQRRSKRHAYDHLYPMFKPNFRDKNVAKRNFSDPYENMSLTQLVDTVWSKIKIIVFRDIASKQINKSFSDYWVEVCKFGDGAFSGIVKLDTIMETLGIPFTNRIFSGSIEDKKGLLKDVLDLEKRIANHNFFKDYENKFDKESKNAMAYLFSRGLDKNLIYGLLRNNLLKQETNLYGGREAKWAVFLNRNEDGFITDCFKRGCNYYVPSGLSKLDDVHNMGMGIRLVVGSDNNCSSVFPTNCDGKTLYCYEAFIDTLSHISLMKNNDVPLNDKCFIAQGGTAKCDIVIDTLKNNNFKNLVIAYDNDEAGNKAAEKLKALIASELPDREITIKEERSVGKDWNDDLMNQLGLKSKTKEERFESIKSEYSTQEIKSGNRKIIGKER